MPGDRRHQPIGQSPPRPPRIPATETRHHLLCRGRRATPDDDWQADADPVRGLRDQVPVIWLLSSPVGARTMDMPRCLFPPRYGKGNPPMTSTAPATTTP